MIAHCPAARAQAAPQDVEWIRSGDRPSQLGLSFANTASPGLEARQGRSRSEQDHHEIGPASVTVGRPARRFGSLAGRRRTSNLITTLPDLTGAQTSIGPREDSTTNEVLSDSVAVVPGGRRRSAFGSRFSATPSTPSALHLRDSTVTSGYNPSHDSGTLGRWGTIGRRFNGAKVSSKSSAAGPVPGLAVRIPGKEVEHQMGEPLAAAANASTVEPVVVEEPGAEARMRVALCTFTSA